jgi:predicted Fe-S protein YdhL (DUF1289 family)
MKFTPCLSKSLCTEDGTHCRGCGRSHEEIARIRELTASVAQFMAQMNYENPEAFTQYLADKALKKLNARRSRSAAEC